jgi:hypothetical protein
MPGNKLFDVAKQRVGIANGETVVSAWMLDKFSVRN